MNIIIMTLNLGVEFVCVTNRFTKVIYKGVVIYSTNSNIIYIYSVCILYVAPHVNIIIFINIPP